MMISGIVSVLAGIFTVLFALLMPYFLPIVFFPWVFVAMVLAVSGSVCFAAGLWILCGHQ